MKKLIDKLIHVHEESENWQLWRTCDAIFYIDPIPRLLNDSAKFQGFKMTGLEWRHIGSSGPKGMMIRLALGQALWVVVCVFLFGIVGHVGGLASGAGGDWSWDPEEIGKDGLPCGRPLIIGHRGSCGMYPEHTALSHEEAAKQGADVLECDMVLTKVSLFILLSRFKSPNQNRGMNAMSQDLQVICSHESWISGVSNVNDNAVGPEHEDFSERLTTVNFTSEVDPG